MTEKIAGFQIVDIDKEIVGEAIQDELFEGTSLETNLSQDQELLLSHFPKTEQDHAHHWVIDEPNGEFSMGCCKNCKEKRKFSNRPPGDADRTTRSEHFFGLGY